MSKKYTAIDLFAGAGGFSLAAHQEDFKLLAAIEFDQNAAKTYQHNIVNRLGEKTDVIAQDINKVDVKAFVKSTGLKKGDLDLVMGGPPCQGFSSHRIKGAGEDDPRNQLLLRYFDFVSALMPKVFLVENVPGLLWPRHEEYLNKFISLAHDHEYKIIGEKPLIINARDYGVPQSRRRAFILAVREDVTIDNLQWPPTPSHVKPDFTKLDQTASWKSASTVFQKPPQEVLDSLIPRMMKILNWSEHTAKYVVDELEFGEDINEGDSAYIHMKHKDFMLHRIRDTKLMGSREESDFTLPCHQNGYSGHKDVYGRMFFHTPSNTMTTGCNNPSKGRFLHPWLNHGITLRHAARLQSFPDEYEFLGGSMASAKQIGNAVPINLGKALISQIKNELLMHNKKL
jgi:DNA (cytosine-5)-methyltransferase 1